MVYRIVANLALNSDRILITGRLDDNVDFHSKIWVVGKHHRFVHLKIVQHHVLCVEFAIKRTQDE